MSTASAVLRQDGKCFCFHFFQVPMSTASAVLRLNYVIKILYVKNGTYVYCFGGIET